MWKTFAATYDEADHARGAVRVIGFKHANGQPTGGPSPVTTSTTWPTTPRPPGGSPASSR